MLAARALLLAEDVGDVIGAEGAGRMRLGDGAGHGVRAVLPHQFEQFGDLAHQRAIGVRQAAEIGLGQVRRTQAVEETE